MKNRLLVGVSLCVGCMVGPLVGTARAQTGYIRALVDHGESTLAPGAAWNRARIEQATRGEIAQAAGSPRSTRLVITAAASK